MLNEPLPTEADIRKLAVKQAKFSNCFAVSHLSRFAAATEQDDAKVSVEFEFGLDEQRRYQLLGKVSCSTLVICQRCLEAMPLVLECNVNIVVVYDDIQAKQLPKAIEPLVVADGEVIDLNEIVEDELLLNMPFTNFHQNEHCYARSQQFNDPNQPDDSNADAGQSNNPFSVLQTLKDDD